MSNLRDILSKPKYEIKNLVPSEDRILWRYTDIPSVIEMLTYEYLPLIRVSRLSDPSEGAIIKAAINKLPGAADFGKDHVFDVYKKTSFVSCWCESKEELAPMWERFSLRDGVAIKTNAKRLLECYSRKGLTIRYVKYINENPDDVFSELAELDYKEFEKFREDLFFYKLSDFEDEREVRILQCRKLINFAGMVVADGTNQYRIEKDMVDHVIPEEDIVETPIDSMNDFITEIVVSPTARPGIYKIVRKLIETLNEVRVSKRKPELKIKVRESRRTMWY